jgi:hypothetical protein
MEFDDDALDVRLEAENAAFASLTWQTARNKRTALQLKDFMGVKECSICFVIIYFVQERFCDVFFFVAIFF